MGYDRGDSFPFNFLNQMEFNLVQNRTENCHHDHIQFNAKGNGNIIFSVHLHTHRLDKNTAIRRIAVRETGVSRHHRGSIQGRSETPRAIKALYRIERCKEDPSIEPP